MFKNEMRIDVHMGMRTDGMRLLTNSANTGIVVVHELITLKEKEVVVEW